MKKTVFLTGATGNMGWAGFQELYARKERFNIRILARDSRKNRKMLAEYINDPALSVIWGDLTRYEDVLAGVAGSDYVLHVGGMVSPAADYFPEKTLKVNVTAAENVVKAVLAQPNKDEKLSTQAGPLPEDKGNCTFLFPASEVSHQESVGFLLKHLFWRHKLRALPMIL